MRSIRLRQLSRAGCGLVGIHDFEKRRKTDALPDRRGEGLAVWRVTDTLYIKRQLFESYRVELIQRV